MIRDVCRDPYDGIGKPEALHGEWSGWYSRWIDSAHRLVYRVEGDFVLITQFRFHYSD